MSLKIKLIASISAFCLILGMLIVGVFALREQSLSVGGSIKFTAVGINAEITEGSLNGVKDERLPDLLFSTDSSVTQKLPSASWGKFGEDLTFEEKNGSVEPVTISFKITNHDEAMLYVLTDYEGPKPESDIYSKFLVSTFVTGDYGAPAAINLPKGGSVVFTITLSLFDNEVDLALTNFSVSIGLYTESALPKDIESLTNNSHNNISYTVNTNHTLELADGRTFAGGDLEIPRTLKVVEGEKTYICAVTSIKDAIYNEGSGFVDGFNGAFYFRDISTLALPNTLTKIGNYAFDECSSFVETVIIPSGVDTIGESAFHCNGPIYSVIIPAGVKTIGDWAFGECGISELIIPNSVETIGQLAFDSCDIEGEIKIPKSVKKLGDSAFNACQSLTSIIIESENIEIEGNPLTDCDNITSIKINKNNTKYKDCGCNIIFDTENKILVTGCGDFEMPNDIEIKSIGFHAFGWCDRLTSIVIPASITDAANIGEGAFCSCSKLATIIIDSPAVAKALDDARYCGDLLSNRATKTVKVKVQEGIDQNTVGSYLKANFAYQGVENGYYLFTR